MENSEVLFLPLGGTGEIGMNVNLYQYKGKWLMIDCGAGFADNDIPGVDIVVADIQFIEERKEDLVGIIITHIHEDHCGGLAYLWEKLKVPVYATRFAANFIEKKLSNKRLDIPINVVATNTIFEIETFKLELINMTHSVPEMSAIAIHTENGVIFHSGDWKIDDNPVVGEKLDFTRLKELSKIGILATICDSTNVFSSGKSESESILYITLKKAIEECKGAVVATVFSSNIARIETISRICKELGKQAAVCGRALINIITAAKQSGYLEDFQYIEGQDVFNHENKNNLIILCTGCQGDKLAAINRLSEKNYPYFALRKDDAVIFSSKIIPGNEKRISNVINRFIAMGVFVITEKTHKVHVSGHPYRDELKEMYSILKPNALIPVHGENMHLYEHAHFAKECGIKHSIVPADGDVIRITQDGIEKINQVEVGFYCVDNEQLQHPEGEIIKTRSRLQQAGLILVVLVTNRAFHLVKKPTIASYGYSGEIKIEKLSSTIFGKLNMEDKKNPKAMVQIARKLVKQFLFKGSKVPTIEVHIERV